MSSAIIDYLRDCRGSGTSVISLYLPAGASIQKARARITTELATASNIKDKTNRHSVIAALKAVVDVLSTVRENSDTGLAIFAGQCV